MSNSENAKKAVTRAILSAYDDHTKGTVANVRFNVEHLATVMKLVVKADPYNAAVATCEEEMIKWIKAAGDAGGDLDIFGRARAALSLQNKITAPRHRGYRPDGSGGFVPVN